jgi:hypothetical protein
MPAACARAGIFWCAFLHNTSRRYAVMLTLNQVKRHDRNDDRSCQQSGNGRSMIGRNAALPVLSIDVLVCSNVALRQHNNR